jgi:hypothetical protein
MSRFIGLFVCLFFVFVAKGQVGIGTNSVDASAKLQIDASNKGFLPPRVSLTGTSDVSTIANPATGLLVYNIATVGTAPTNVSPGFYYYNGTAWTRLIVPTDNAANISGIVSVSNGGTGSATRNFVDLTSSETIAGSKSFSNDLRVGTSTPTASALVELSSTTQGFLPSRMTWGQRNAISSPAAGLMVYCTNCGANGEFQFYNGASWVNMIGGQASLPIIGTPMYGGVLAYILQSGDPGYDANVHHGLIAAVADVSSGAPWGCSGTSISAAQNFALGAGNQNTVAIMNGCATAGIAARLCGDLVEGGYSDWYLPSSNELQKLKNSKDLIGGFSNTLYWSSTEGLNSSASLAEPINFGSNTIYGTDLYKTNTHRVRAVRSF